MLSNKWHGYIFLKEADCLLGNLVVSKEVENSKQIVKKIVSIYLNNTCNW